MLILKAFIDDSIPVRNFEFQKKELFYCKQKAFSSEVFTVIDFFSGKTELCKKCNLKAIQLN